MSIIFTANEYCNRLLNIATNYKTLYVMGGIGYRLNSNGKQRAMQNSWNTKPPRPTMINQADEHTWAFDCVCLLKSVLWGWVGDESKLYGGGTYASNSVPDVSADGMINMCSGVSTDFSNIQKGEAVWMSGHIGCYIGDGKVVECTPKWDNKVQVTNLGNIAKFKMGNYREWTKHGKLPWIQYAAVPTPAPQPTPTPCTDVETYIWNRGMEEIGNPIGVAGIMGNWDKESGLKTNNLENLYNNKFHMTDEQYTAAVNDGSYNMFNFVHDAAGYGIAQWTYWSRKQALYDYMKKNNNLSIDDLKGQVDFAFTELKTSYKGVFDILKNAKTIQEASDAVLIHYENPADKSNAVKTARANAGLAIYNRHYKESKPTPEPVYHEFTVTYIVTAGSGLNIRDGAGTNNKVIGGLPYNTKFKVSKTSNGWGYIPDNNGWACLDYAKRV